MGVQHYLGGCQCGAVRFQVDADLDHTVACNCSRCRPLGAIFTFVPAAAFTLEKGEGATTEYLFNTGKIHHLFCSACGIESFARGEAPDGSAVIAVNARCLDGVDPKTLHPSDVDGASR